MNVMMHMQPTRVMAIAVWSHAASFMPLMLIRAMSMMNAEASMTSPAYTSHPAIS